MNKKSLISLIIIGPLLSFLWLGIYSFYLYQKPYEGEQKQFIIKPGEAFGKINYRLKQENIVTASRIFHKVAQYKGVMEKFKPGTYTIEPGMNMALIMDKFVEGAQVFIDVTIPEGKNMFEVAKILADQELVTEKDFITTAKDKEFLKTLNIEADRVEGYLYPDTYKFEPYMKSKDIIRIMVKNFFSKIEGLNYSDTGFTLHQWITLSSIVEKETGAAFERPMIAGVFLNRLKKRMRLQSDPTTIYGIWENFNGNLRKKHLLEKTDYNTYKIPALPKGPICNPGVDALKAVINPDKHKFLYFVSKNDGTHIFTPTYKDHLKAVREWQINRNNRKGKSWRDLDQNLRANQ